MDYKYSIRVAFAIHEVLYEWEAVSNFASLGLQDSSVEPLIILSHECRQRNVLRTEVEGFSPISLRDRFGKEGSPSTDSLAVCPLAFNRKDEVNAVFLFLAAIMMTNLRSVVKDVHFCTLP